jgi:hypothetical protein
MTKDKAIKIGLAIFKLQSEIGRHRQRRQELREEITLLSIAREWEEAAERVTRYHELTNIIGVCASSLASHRLKLIEEGHSPAKVRDWALAHVKTNGWGS